MKLLSLNTQALTAKLNYALVVFMLAALVGAVMPRTNVQAFLICDDPIHGTSECPGGRAAREAKEKTELIQIIAIVATSLIFMSVATAVIIRKRYRHD